MSNITVISQVDTKSRSRQWLLSFMGIDGSSNLGRLHKDDLVRELKTSGNLQNMLRKEQEAQGEEEAVRRDFLLYFVISAFSLLFSRHFLSSQQRPFIDATPVF